MKRIFSLCLIVCLAVAVLSSCGKEVDENKILVGASATPHSEILNIIKDDLKKEGITLEVKIYDDYILPNTATEDGDIDVNYFQHTPYLNDFNKENGTHLVPVLSVHYEPYGIYKGYSKSLDEIPDGAKIAVPNDTTNEARALLLLEANGLIKIKSGAGLTATKRDITENKHNYDIVEMEAAAIPECLDSVAVAVINGNYAINSGLKVSEALAVEDKNSEAAQTYANILVVKEGNQNKKAVKALVKAVKSDKVKKFIEDTYDGAVVAIF